MTDLDHLIDDLADRAEPVAIQKTDQGRLILGGVGLFTLLLVALMFGVRTDIAAFTPAPLITVTTGLFALLGFSAGAHAVRMANPQVGAPTSGAHWLVAALALLPLAAVAAMAADHDHAEGLLLVGKGVECLTIGLAAGTASLVFLGLWLRKGAPVAPERASWLAGLAAGSVGAAAVTIECGYSALSHLAFWHVAVVAVMAGASRLLLPRLIRW